MAISPFTADVLQGAEIEKAVVELAQAIGLRDKRVDEASELIEHSLPELYQIFCEQVVAQRPIDNPQNAASRFAGSLSAFTRKARRTRVFRITRLSNDRLEGLFRMFCAGASEFSRDEFHESARIYLRGGPPLVQVPIAEICLEDVRKLLDDIGEDGSARLAFKLWAVVDAFNTTAQSELGNRESVRLAQNLVKRQPQDESCDVSRVHHMMNLLFSSQTRSHIESFGYRMNDWFLDDFLVGTLSSVMEKAETAIGAKDQADLSEAVKELKSKADEVVHKLNLLKTLRDHLSDILFSSGVFSEMHSFHSMIDEWHLLLTRVRSLNHDFGNVMAAISGHIELLGKIDCTDDKAIGKYIAVLKRFDPSTVGSLLSSVQGILCKHEEGVGIEINASEELSCLKIPEEYRGALFRMLFEFVLNAIKNRDENKAEQKVIMSASMEKNSVSLAVSDNGLGMDVDEVLRHPERAKGTGLGLPGSKNLAKRKGWEVNIESELGKGTNVTIEVDTAHWNKQGPEGNEANPITRSGISGIAGSGGMSGVPHASIYQSFGAHGFMGCPIFMMPNSLIRTF